MQVFTYALLGLGLGAMYSLASQGLVLIYRGSGVLNFAQGAIGMVGAYVEWEIAVQHGLPFGLALVCGVVASALLGAATHLLVMRQLRRASPLARIVATLGVLITLQAAVIVKYGSTVKFIPSALPTHVINLGDGVKVSTDRLYLLLIAAVLTVVLWALYKYTRFGLGTSAVAENQRAAATLGWSPDVIATVNWTLGSALAGLAAILISPIVTLQVTGTDQSGARRPGRRADRLFPLVPDRLRGLGGHRRGPDRADPLRHPARVGPVGAVHRHRGGDGGDRPGPAAPRLLPAAAAIDRQRPDTPDVGALRGRRWRWC